MSIRYTTTVMERKTLPQYVMLLRITWKNYLQRFDVILIVNLLVALPINVLLDLTTPRHLYDSELPIPTQDPIAFLNAFTDLILDPTYLANIVIQLLASFIMVYVVVAVIVSMKNMYLRKPQPVSIVLRQAAELYPRALVVSVIISVLTAIGFFFFIVPGIIIGLVFSLALPALVWHDMSSLKALKYSIQTIRRNWLYALSYLILTSFIVSSVLFMIITVVPDTFGFTTAGLTIISIFSSFITVFEVVLFTALDLDIKKEAVRIASLNK